MKVGKGFNVKLVSAIAAFCLAAMCLTLAACGGTASSSAASSSSAGSSSAASSEASASSSAESASASAASPEASSSASASASAASESASASSSEASASASAAADSGEGVIGKWTLAAAEQNGVIMGGNFGELLGIGDAGTLTFEADGTGTIVFGEEPGTFSWAEEADGTIHLTPTSESEAMIQSTVPITLKDGTLFMEVEQNDQKATAIFTRDGNYAGAKQISLEGAVPITSEEELLGTWGLVGMNMGGISMTGDSGSLESMMAGGESKITFKEGGVAEMSVGDGTWAVDANGATITSDGLTGKVTCPILKLGDEILIDYSESFGGVDFIVAFAKQ